LPGKLGSVSTGNRDLQTSVSGLITGIHQFDRPIAIEGCDEWPGTINYGLDESEIVLQLLSQFDSVCPPA
jgi:hypothetical protein